MAYKTQTIVNNNSQAVIDADGKVTQSIMNHGSLSPDHTTPTQKIPDFTIKTLYQKVGQIIETSKSIKFAEAVTLGQPYQTIEGGYIEYGDIFPTTQANFNEGAFVPTDLNFNTTGTGVLTNNRNDVDNNWQQKYRFVMPLANDDNNYYQFIVTYKKSAYKNKLLDESFITSSIASLEYAANLLLANRIIAGFDAIGPMGIIHYDGIADLVDNAKAGGTPTTEIPENLAGFASKYIDASNGGANSNLETMANLNTILDKIANTNSCFCYGTTDEAGAVKYVSNACQPMMICWNKLRRAIEMQNFQFYKDINTSILGTNSESVGGAGQSQTGYQNLITIPETTLDIRFETVGGAKKSTLINIINSTALNATDLSINLEDDEILLINPQAWVLGQFDDKLIDVDNTSNNITAKHTIILHGNCQAYLPTGAVCVVKTNLLSFGERD